MANERVAAARRQTMVWLTGRIEDNEDDRRSIQPINKAELTNLSPLAAYGQRGERYGEEAELYVAYPQRGR